MRRKKTTTMRGDRESKEEKEKEVNCVRQYS